MRRLVDEKIFFRKGGVDEEIMRMGIASLLESGITEDEMRIMVQYNPATLLGLEAEHR